MRTILRFAVCSLLLTANATFLFAQWEWAGGIPAPSFGTVGAAGKWIIASGIYSGEWPVSTTDAGESWSTLSGVGPTVFNPVLVTAPEDTFLLAVGAGYSIYRLRDTAQTWVRSDSGLGGAQVQQLAYLAATESFPQGVVVAASPLSGIFRSTDLGVHWSASDSGLTTLNAPAIVAIDSILLVGTWNHGVFRSVDHGITWSSSSTGLADTSFGILATSAGWVFAASGANVYRSSDKGETWSLLPKSVPASALNLVLVPTPGRGTGVALFAVQHRAITGSLPRTRTGYLSKGGRPRSTYPTISPTR